MSSTDIVLLSASAALGAIVAAAALRYISSTSRKHSSSLMFVSEKTNGNAGAGASSPDTRNPFDPSKRKSYLSWDDYFMAIAFLSAERSKDPNRQVGACLVSESGIILGIGYNGFPRGCSDDDLPWAKKSPTGNPLETKYPYVCHAEVNTILNTNHASANGDYMLPCSRVMSVQKLLSRWSGVKEVVYFVEKRLGNLDTIYAASHKLLSMAKVKVRKHQPEMSQILIKFSERLNLYRIV